MIVLTKDGMRKIFPRAPATIINAFVDDHEALDRAGITATRTRLSYAFTNVEHESLGYTILTELTNYRPKTAFRVFKSRLAMNNIVSVAEVERRFGVTSSGHIENRRAFFNMMYGTRMGNRAGTDDGWDFIGRGGPQLTGREAYDAVGRRIGVDLVSNPALAADPKLQPAILAAMWTWKNMNPTADAGNFVSVVRKWNGGTNGLADRQALLAGNNPVVARLATRDKIATVLDDEPGTPPTQFPTKEVLGAATSGERKTRTAGAATAGGSAATKATEVAVDTGGLIPDWIIGAGIAVGIVVVIIAAVLIYRKRQAVVANWR